MWRPSMALEVVLADGPAEVGPLATLAPEIRQAPFAQHLLETRIRTHAGVHEQPCRVPGPDKLSPRCIEVSAKRGQCEVTVSQRICQDRRGFRVSLSALGGVSDDRQHALAVRERGSDVIP